MPNFRLIANTFIFTAVNIAIPNLYSEDSSGENIVEYSYWQELIKIIIVLGIILSVMFIIAHFFKKFLNSRMYTKNNSSKIQILERRTLSPKSAVYLIDILGQGFVVGETPHGLQRLGEISKEQIISHNHGASTFQEHLNSSEELKIDS